MYFQTGVVIVVVTCNAVHRHILGTSVSVQVHCIGHIRLELLYVTSLCCAVGAGEQGRIFTE